MGRGGKKSDGALVLLALIGLILYFISKIILTILPFLIILAIAYFFIKWQNKKLKKYNGNWSLFYKKELKNKLKIILLILPLLIAFFLFRSYNQQKIEKLRVEKLAAEAQKLKSEEERIQLLKDSSNFYLKLAISSSENKKLENTLKYLDSSLVVYPLNYEAQFQKGIILQKNKRYQEALNIFNDISNKTDQFSYDLFLIKGHSLLKMNRKKEAIASFYKASQLGNREAKLFYEKLNPLVKKVIGYRTKCCDGTYSKAKGKGACSHHGGVCNWNEPIYSETRKY